MPIALIVSAAVAVSVSIASQWATPGDPLYPVKIGVNERIESALTMSFQSQAQLEAEAEAQGATALQLSL